LPTAFKEIYKINLTPRNFSKIIRGVGGYPPPPDTPPPTGLPTEYQNEISYGKTDNTSHIWNASKNMDNELKRKRQIREE
jgi:hypothetical protein